MKQKVIVAAVAALVPFCGVSLSVSAAEPAPEVKQLFQDNCGTCHGADRGGYIGPALTKERVGGMSANALRAMIISGIPDTLMPPWAAKLSDEQIRALVGLIQAHPKDQLEWSLEDAQKTVKVLATPDMQVNRPTYQADVVDLVAVMGRGRYGNGAESKVVFFDGKTNKVVGEVPTGTAPHILRYDPTNPRWAFVKTDKSEIFKIDLYTMKALRSVRAGLTGPSLDISADGKWLIAGSFIPGMAMILKAETLEPVKYIKLEGNDIDGKFVASRSGGIHASAYGNQFVINVKDAGQVWLVDLNKPELPITKIEKVGRFLHDSFLSRDGRYVMVADYKSDKVAVIDLKEKAHIRDIPAGCTPHLGSGSITKVGDRYLAFGTNIGSCDKGHLVTVWDMKDFSVVKQIPVAGPTESPAAHPAAPYVAVDIVTNDKRAKLVQLIDKSSLEVVKTLDVGGHSHFPEYNRDGRYLYVSAGYAGDKVRIYDSKTLELVAEHKMQVPAGIFAHARTLWGGTKGLEEEKVAAR